MRAGQRISFAVPISGSPPPKASWAVEGKQLETTDRVDVTTTGSITTLDIPTAVRGDTGRYVLTLENNLGSVSASANVTVVDKPGRKIPLDLESLPNIETPVPDSYNILISDVKL